MMMHTILFALRFNHCNIFQFGKSVFIPISVQPVSEIAEFFFCLFHRYLCRIGQQNEIIIPIEIRIDNACQFLSGDLQISFCLFLGCQIFVPTSFVFFPYRPRGVKFLHLVYIPRPNLFPILWHSHSSFI